MKLLITMICFSFLIGCAQPGDPNYNLKRSAGIGVALGAVAGAVIGHQADHSGGALRGGAIGAAAGGALGAGVGYHMDRQQQELEAQLATEQELHQIDFERLDDDTLKLTFDASVFFGINAYTLSEQCKISLRKTASILQKYPKTSVHVIGHTDNTGSFSMNMLLSENRAKAVAYYLEDYEINRRRLIVEGRSSLDPRDSNSTEVGRQRNRRVELLLYTAS